MINDFLIIMQSKFLQSNHLIVLYILMCHIRVLSQLLWIPYMLSRALYSEWNEHEILNKAILSPLTYIHAYKTNVI